VADVFLLSSPFTVNTAANTVFQGYSVFVFGTVEIEVIGDGTAGCSFDGPVAFGDRVRGDDGIPL
jgi:hypothetical protein